MGLIFNIKDGDWSSVRQAIAKLGSLKLGPTSTPTFGSIGLTDLTTNSLVYSASGGVLTSLGAATNGQLPIGSTGAAPVLATITGTTNQVVSTPGAGMITLSTPQDIAITSSVIFGGATLQKDATQATLNVSVAHDTESTAGSIVFKKSDGSLASPALVDDNAVLGTIKFQGHDGSVFRNAARIEGRIEGTPSTGADMPGEITFWTTPDGSASPVENMSLSSYGRLRIGPVTIAIDEQKLHISGTDTSPATSGSSQESLLRFGTYAANQAGCVFDVGMYSANGGPWLQATNYGNHATNYPISLNPNGGNVGVQTPTPTLPLSVLEKSGMTPIGGFAIKLINNTGVNSVEGQLVEADDTDENSYKVADADAVDVIGVVYNAGVADGSEVWIVVMGIAEVLLDAGGCVHHDRLVSSNTAGSADVSNTPAIAVHFQEIGHAVETVVGAGLAKAVIHLL